MHDTLQKTMPPGTEFGGGHIRKYRRCCMIDETKRRPAVVQAQRRIDRLADQSVEPFAGNRFHHLAENHEAQIAVKFRLTDAVSQRRPGDRPQQGVPPHLGRYPNQLGIIRPVIRQARRMVEKLPNGNGGFLGSLENIQQGRQRLSKCQPAVCDQQHYRQCGRQGFGQRGEIENRFSAHRFLSETIAYPAGKKIFNHPLSGDKEYAAGKYILRYGLMHQIMQTIKFHRRILSILTTEGNDDGRLRQPTIIPWWPGGGMSSGVDRHREWP